MARSWIRFWFCIVVAVVAAAIADPLIEAASNAGWFGPRNYTDHSNLDIAPALCVAALLAGLHLFLRVRHLLRGGSGPLPRWLRMSGDALAGRRLCSLLPRIFVAQLVALYCMETIEQIAVAGHPLGGTLWLGGPVLVSLALHAIACLAITFIAGEVMRCCARSALRIARFILRILTSISRLPRTIVFRRRSVVSFRVSDPIACRIGERAPPFLLA
jgi:hypothetical protein